MQSSYWLQSWTPKYAFQGQQQQCALKCDQAGSSQNVSAGAKALQAMVLLQPLLGVHSEVEIRNIGCARLRTNMRSQSDNKTGSSAGNGRCGAYTARSACEQKFMRVHCVQLSAGPWLCYEHGPSQAVLEHSSHTAEHSTCQQGGCRKLSV